MTHAKVLVLDANILIRAVFGNRVDKLLANPDSSVIFHSPEICFVDAGRHIEHEVEYRNLDGGRLRRRLERLADLVQIVGSVDYLAFEVPASNRIRSRDISDWPIVATCLLLDAPLWTEDRDFFGCGIATWTTNNVGIYFEEAWTPGLIAD